MKRIIRIGMDVHSTNYTLCAMEPIIGEIPKAIGIPSDSMNKPISTIGRGRFSLLKPYCLSSSASSISK